MNYTEKNATGLTYPKEPSLREKYDKLRVDYSSLSLEHESLQEERDALRAALEACQWGSDNFSTGGFCWACQASVSDGHKDGCQLAAALAMGDK